MGTYLSSPYQVSKVETLQILVYNLMEIYRNLNPRLFTRYLDLERSSKYATPGDIIISHFVYYSLCTKNTIVKTF